MTGEPEGEPVARLGDLDVVIAPGLAGNGRSARVLVLDSRNRRELIRLPPGEAAALGVVIRAKAAAAGAGHQAAAPAEPEGGDGMEVRH